MNEIEGEFERLLPQGSLDENKFSCVVWEEEYDFRILMARAHGHYEVNPID